MNSLTHSGGNVFGELVHTVEVCSLGQITACLTGVVGKFRPMVWQASFLITDFTEKHGWTGS